MTVLNRNIDPLGENIPMAEISNEEMEDSRDPMHVSPMGDVDPLPPPNEYSIIPYPGGNPPPLLPAPDGSAIVAPLAVQGGAGGEVQAVEDFGGRPFRWVIEHFSKIKEGKIYSNSFVAGGFSWRILVFPKGNAQDSFSMFLDVPDAGNLPNGWSRSAHFTLSVINHFDRRMTMRKDAQHQFNARESDWGFNTFMSLKELYDPQRGYLASDALLIEAEVNVRVDYWSYDSKKETGFVGLKNQGATCYMNSLLQTLYHIPFFRKAVYHMPTTESDSPSSSIPLALQSLFFKIQHSDSSVSTKDLTKSFGWDSYESFMQHDVQELNRVLCEKLEDKMKSTAVEGTIQRLFEGHMLNYIECVNVDYKSTRKESFYDLQLDVKGCKDVYDSFSKYVEVEMLEGENKYHAEQHGLQDARKGVLFNDFPPVLQLQLKRFEYDFMRDTMVKINDRYEFPMELDLDIDNRKYLSPESDKNIRNLYELHSVLVHSGGVHGGHYYAYIRPELKEQWLKFDDERVTKEDLKKALDEQFGGEEEISPQNPGFNNVPFKFTKYSNAYMLVYIRTMDRDKIFCAVDDRDIAEHLKLRLRREQEEKERKRKEKAEAHLYTIIKVARDEDLRAQIGKELFFDLVDHDKVQTFRIQKAMKFSHFKSEIENVFKIPVQCQRFWMWAKRQNHTYRPARPLTAEEESQPVGSLRDGKSTISELRLFLEGEPISPEHPLPIPLPEKGREEILLFFKLYNPMQGTLHYVGRLFVKLMQRPIDIRQKLNEMVGFPAGTELALYEEVKYEPIVMCEALDRKASFKNNQLEDGDIICVQRALTEAEENTCRFPVVGTFLEFVRNRQEVRFRRLDKPKEDEFTLELSKLHSYDDVVERVARRVGAPSPSLIRLTAHNCYSQQPKPPPIRYRGVEKLNEMLVHYNQVSDILYYETLDIPLPELQELKTLKISFYNSRVEELCVLNLRLPKTSTIADVIGEIRSKVKRDAVESGTEENKLVLSRPDAEIRLLEVFYHKIYKTFPLSDVIENINDQYWTLRAEEIPEEEIEMGANDRLIHVYHFTSDPQQPNSVIQNFGDPFYLLVREKETLREIKARVHQKLQVPDEEFAKWKFAFLSLGRPEYLEDEEIVAAKFRAQIGAWEHYLGMEHTDSNPKKPHHNHSNRHSTYEKPVKIYN